MAVRLSIFYVQIWMLLKTGLLNSMQEYEWPDGSVEVGGADYDMWKTIGEGLNFDFR